MKEIKIGNSYRNILVDDEDYARIRIYHWTLNSKLSCVKCPQTTVKYCNLKVSNMVMQNFEVMYDHKDRNPLNNQKDNLRICDFSQNNMNRIKAKGNFTSKYKGVSKVKNKLGLCSFEVRVIKDQKIYYLGTFYNEKEAATAYNNKAKELFGEFAHLNEI